MQTDHQLLISFQWVPTDHKIQDDVRVNGNLYVAIQLVTSPPLPSSTPNQALSEKSADVQSFILIIKEEAKPIYYNHSTENKLILPQPIHQHHQTSKTSSN